MRCLGLRVDGVPGDHLDHLQALVLDEPLALLGGQADLALFDYGLGDRQGIGGSKGLEEIIFCAAVAAAGVLKYVLYRQDILQAQGFAPSQGVSPFRLD
jgi:hypothetical protein